jgi:hypothetical protein
MGIFGKTRFLDPDVEDWCLKTWAWLMTNLGGMQRLHGVSLTAPTREYFPPTAAEGREQAAYVFERVKSLMGMEGWPCEIEAYGRSPALQSVGLFGKSEQASAPNGTFRLDGARYVIGYAADLATQPEPLIATFSHELAACLVTSIGKPVPGGQDFRELATELALGFCGFGLFGMNGAYRAPTPRNPFAQRAVNFPEPTWAFVLALFATLKGVPIPAGALKPGVADLTAKAMDYLKKNEDLVAPLRAIA